MTWAHLLLVALVLTSTACGSSSTDDSTRVRVWFEADPGLVTRAATLRVRVIDADDAVRDVVQDLVAKPMPLAVDLRPRGGDASRPFQVEASLLDDAGLEIARQRVVGMYVANEAREIRVVFRSDCEDVLCGEELTCMAGSCAGACYGTGDMPGACSPIVDSGVDGSVDTGPSCDPMVPPSCTDLTLTLCEGGVPSSVPCLLGCTSETTCRLPVPSNVPTAPLDESPAELRVPNGETWIIDTADGAIDAWEGAVEGLPTRSIRDGVDGDDGAGLVFRLAPSTVAPGTTGSYGVLTIGRLVIEEGATFVGVGPHPLVLLVATDAIIDGTLSVAANRGPERGPGAGGFPGADEARGDGPGAGGKGTAGEPYNRGGGGGGGFGHAGADGGGGRNSSDTTVFGEGGAGGPTYGDAMLMPLVGGSSGGAAGGWASGMGGHGGGALQLTAGRSIHVRGVADGASGIVDASGGGGVGERLGGGGGGSGGGLLLEAPTVVVDGIVGTNGGAGAPGDLDAMVCDGDYGPAEDGRAERVPAPGVTLGFGCSGDGGDGSGFDGAASDGGTGRDGGGGGGGGGRIRINTFTGMEAFDTGVVPRPLTTIGVIAPEDPT